MIGQDIFTMLIKILISKEGTMELPKYTPKQKKTHKHCKYLNCGKPFWGTPIQKYCEYHTDPHHRKRIRPKPEGPAVKNQLFYHGFQRTTQIEFACALDGCHETFMVEVYPKQFVYPKYCQAHRSEYQRENFLRQKRLRVAC